MDPGPPSPNSIPAAGTVAEPFGDRPAFADTFLAAPQAVGELGRLGHYRILDELGRGGMGVVYRAEDTVMGRAVAVKVLLPSAANDARAAARFRREAEAQAAVEHPHVAPVYGVGEANGVAFLVMPLLKGMSLAAALKLNPRPPLASAVRIGREIAEGLAAAHEKGLIHRDIKPGNVWLDGAKLRVKILDFGLARVSGERATLAAPTVGTMTATGAIVGTPAYMCPEQARSQPTDHRSDLFSLGVVLYQMAAGVLPFTGENTFDVMAAAVAHHPPPAHQANPGVPRPLSDLIARLMAKKPAERPSSAAAVAEELAMIGLALKTPALPTVSAVPASAAPTGPDVWSGLADAPTDVEAADTAQADATDFHEPSRRSRHWLWLLAGGGAALLAVGLLAWALVGSPGKSKPTGSRPLPGPSADTSSLPPVPPPKREPEPPKPEPEADRAAAEKLIAVASLSLVAEGGKEVRVPRGGPLPAGRFIVAVIDFDRTDGQVLNAAFVSNVFLPAVSQLRMLAEVRTDVWQMTLSADHIRQMAAMPLADTLRVLQLMVELSPASLPDLKRFRVLDNAVFKAPQASDAVVEEMAKLPLRHLALFGVRSDAVTERGWNAVAGMRLERFTMWSSRGADAALKAFAARPGPLPTLRFMHCDLSDGGLATHLKPDTDLREIEVQGGDVSELGLATLGAVKRLRVLTLEATRVQLNAATQAAAARPDLRITYNGYTIPQKKK